MEGGVEHRDHGHVAAVTACNTSSSTIVASTTMTSNFSDELPQFTISRCTTRCLRGGVSRALVEV
jgi:hypothetical protein